MRIVLVEFTWQANKIINNKEYYKNDVIVSLDPGSSYIFKVNNIEYLENSHFCNHNKLWENYKNITDQSLKITKVLDEALWNIDSKFKKLNWKISVPYTLMKGAAPSIIRFWSLAVYFPVIVVFWLIFIPFKSTLDTNSVLCNSTLKLISCDKLATSWS